MAAGEPDDRRAVVFDLDRTLIGCDSFAGCLNGLLLRDWWRVGAVIAVSPLLLPLWFTDTTRPAALRGLLWWATVGLDRSVFDAALVDQGRHIASDPGSSIYAEGLQTVRRHLDAGDRVIIVTGSSGILARTLCDRLGLCDVIVVGSSFRPWAGGWVLDEHCAGERKVASLVDAGASPPWSIVYTDSASDLPLLRLAEQRRLVNPRTGAVRVVSRALGADGFEILRWT